MAKYTDWITWILIVIVMAAVVWLIAEPIIWWTEMSETRLYVRVFLIMFAIATFAVLRLYNSIVSNTRFLIKLQEACRSLQSQFLSMERAVKGSTTAMGGLKATMNSLDKTTKENSESVAGLSEKVKSIKITKKQ